MAGRPWTVAVLYGGTSAEREVSLESGRAVCETLRCAGMAVIEADLCGEIESQLDDLQGRCDVAFIALHGTFGEDGGVQRLLEARHIPYTGSGPEASRKAMDKQLTKAAFAQCGLPTPEGVVLSEPVTLESVAGLASAMGYPVVVKPAAQGSSKGVGVVTSKEGLAHALHEAAQFDEKIILERFLPGAEYTVGILNDQPLPIIQIEYEGVTFDYQAKYVSEKTRHVIDPDIDESLRRSLQSLATKAHHALGCRCFSRVDFRLNAEGRPVVLEVNTIPGLTSHSLLPKAAQQAGISFVQLCKDMLASAFTECSRAPGMQPIIGLVDGGRMRPGSA